MSQQTPENTSEAHQSLPEPVEQVRRTIRNYGFGALLTQGIIGLILGLIMLFMPIVSTGALSIFMSVMIGLGLIFFAFAEFYDSNSNRKAGVGGWGWGIASGIVSLIAGLAFLIFPILGGTVAMLTMAWFVILSVILRGIFVIADHRSGGWGIALGVITIIAGALLGIIMLFNPGSTIITFVWVLGIFAVIGGIVSIVGAFRIRNALK